MNADGLTETAVPAPPPGLVTVGRYDEGPGYAVNRPQGADSWLFTWTTGGHGLLTQGTAETRAGAGDLVVLRPGVRHRYLVRPGAPHWRFWWAHCQARPTWTAWLSPYAVGDGMYVVAPVPDALHDRMAAAFARMLSDARWPGSDARPPGPSPASAHPSAPRACPADQVGVAGPGTHSPRGGTPSRVVVGCRLPHARTTSRGGTPIASTPSAAASSLQPHAPDPARVGQDAPLPAAGLTRRTGPGGPIAVAHGIAARELALCSLEEIVLLASTAARPLPERPGIDARVSRAEALIAADPAAPHTVRSLAEEVALSPSRFAHLFTEQLGRSPMRALREARLRHAARLLEATDLPVERVAVASGFASPFHFNRVFRELHGTPPGAYRALCRRGPAKSGPAIGLTAVPGPSSEGTGQLS